MTPTLLTILVLALLAGAAVYAVRRLTRDPQASRGFDLGVVSTRWLSELRRDEPWTRT